METTLDADAQRMRILATLDQHTAAARRHLPGGQLLAEDLQGLYRRVAAAEGISVATFEEAIAWRREQVSALMRANAGHLAQRIEPA